MTTASPLLEQLTAKKTQRLKLAEITELIQLRTDVDADAVARYALAYKAGADALPPIVVFASKAGTYLADGCHRHAAALDAGLKSLPAIVKKGDRRDAVLFAAGANDAHGVGLTNADKRRIVKTLLTDPEWSAWSDREIARRCHVSNTLVGEVRATVSGAQTTKRKSADGRERDVSKIGKKSKKPQQPHSAIHPYTDDTAHHAFHVTLQEKDRIVDEGPIEWAHETEAHIAALLRHHGSIERSDGLKPTAYALSVTRLEEILAQPLGSYIQRLIDMGLLLVADETTDQGSRLVYLTAAADAAITAALAEATASEAPAKSDAPKPAPPAAASAPTKKTKPATLAQRRKQKIRELIADRLREGKVGACTPHQTAALALITGVNNDPERKYNRETVDQALHDLTVDVAIGVADALTGSIDCPNLPDEPELARIYGLDYDALVVLAANAVPE